MWFLSFGVGAAKPERGGSLDRGDGLPALVATPLLWKLGDSAGDNWRLGGSSEPLQALTTAPDEVISTFNLAQALLEAPHAASRSKSR